MVNAAAVSQGPLGRCLQCGLGLRPVPCEKGTPPTSVKAKVFPYKSIPGAIASLYLQDSQNPTHNLDTNPAPHIHWTKLPSVRIW